MSVPFGGVKLKVEAGILLFTFYIAKFDISGLSQ